MKIGENWISRFCFFSAHAPYFPQVQILFVEICVRNLRVKKHVSGPAKLQRHTFRYIQCMTLNRFNHQGSCTSM